jgi:hypothetical protein
MKTIRLCFLALLPGAALLAQAPRIDSIAPNRVPIAGTAVSVRGANFTNATVSIDKVVISVISIAAGDCIR